MVARFLAYLGLVVGLGAVNMGAIGLLARLNGMAYTEAAVYFLLGALVAAEAGVLLGAVWGQRS